jgi:hypothetical protein
MINIHFDDDDNARICVHNVRLLPDDFPITSMLCACPARPPALPFCECSGNLIGGNALCMPADAHSKYRLINPEARAPVLPAFVVRTRRGSSRGDVVTKTRTSTAGDSEPARDGIVVHKLTASSITPPVKCRKGKRTATADGEHAPPTWEWNDEGVMNVRLRRVEHSSVRKGNVVIGVSTRTGHTHTHTDRVQIGDTVHLLHHKSNAARGKHTSPPTFHRTHSTESLPDRPYIAVVRGMWQSKQSRIKRIRVNWYYSAQELNECGLPKALAKVGHMIERGNNVLFTARHIHIDTHRREQCRDNLGQMCGAHT